MANVRKGENKRESWWVKNLSNRTITIGDLLLVPAIKPGKRVDLLHHYTREKISHSTVLVTLVKAGIVSLNKNKSFTNEFPGSISPSNVDEAITPGEENEILKESEANDIYLKLDGSNANQNISINNFGIEEIGFLKVNGNISILSNISKLFLGANQDASIYFDGTDLNISVDNNPSSPGTIKLNDDVFMDGVLKTLSGKIINRTSVTTSPYNILESDHHLSVTTSSIAITLNLPIIVDGTIYHIKDQDEQSSARNITVNPNGSNTIENASSLTIKVNGASITMVGNSTTNNWEIQ